MTSRGGLCVWLALLAGKAAFAQNGTPTAPTGSTAFCLYELPAEEAGRRRWVNLGIVQYVEAGRNEVRLYYGGGHFGSGHVARIAVSGAADAQLVVDRIRLVAASCK